MTEIRLGWGERRVMDSLGIQTLSRFLKKWKVYQGRWWWWRGIFKSQAGEFRLEVSRYLEVLVHF